MINAILYLILSDFEIWIKINAGKGDEMFFDSQAWLDSDNDDFFSVNGG